MTDATLASLADEARERAADPNAQVKPLRFTIGRSKTVWENARWARKQKRVRITRTVDGRTIVKSLADTTTVRIVEGDDGGA